MIGGLAAPAAAVLMVLAQGLAGEFPVRWGASGLETRIDFRPKARAVSNWRIEAARHLDADAPTALGLLMGEEPRALARCIRLNNYWCIKKAGWAGEIAADAEGHVAFASAAEGAAVAALLLRRYYVDYGRHSAQAIVSHWAPSACGAIPARVGGAVHKRRSTAADHLATHGIGGTLRARFLAAHGRRVAGRMRGRIARSVVPDRLIGRMPAAPSIVAGLADPPAAPVASVLLDLGRLAAPGPGTPPRLAALEPTCTGDATRIAAYAARTAAGVAPSPQADLRLFDADGRPTEALGKVMRNMAAVEIGPLGVDPALVAGAVAAVAARTAASASAAPAATAAPATTGSVPPAAPAAPTAPAAPAPAAPGR